MTERELRIDLLVRAPFLTQTTAPGGPGLDAVAARSRPDGPFLLPGTLVKGKLREAWTRLAALAGADAPASPEEIDDWLGQRSDEGNRPARGRLRFLDFEADAAGDPGARYRVEIDRERGGVRRGMLAAIESPFAPGSDVTFRGGITFVADDEKAARIRAAVAAGLRFVDGVGAFRSSGFGRLVGVEVEEVPTARADAAPPVDEDVPGFDLAITVDEPLLLARLQPATNLFAGRPVIPGGALKGALAATWRDALGRSPSGSVTAELDPDRRELGEHFARLRFTHAFLGTGGRRPATVPLSLVRVATGNDETPFRSCDVALLDGPHLVSDRAPTFAVDWKTADHRWARAHCGWASPRRETRVRTAIDGKTRKGADGELFAYETVLPEADQRFYARVELPDLDAGMRARIAGQLRSLLEHGLRHLGKTKARAWVEIEPRGTIRSALETRHAGDDPIVVVLQTSALLLDPLELDEQSGRSELLRAYRAAFGGLSRDLVLQRFFACQRLAGGGYLRHRFQREKPYHPYLLTEAGSVFVFDRSAAAEAVVDGWRRRGLALPGWAAERYAGPDADGVERPGDDWRRCPFLPENGYGEVAVDLAIHRDLHPGSDASKVDEITVPEDAP